MVSTTALLIARLVAENVSPELIGDIAEALADARAAERVLEKRRAADRERKAVANPRIPRNSTEGAEIQLNGSKGKNPPDPIKTQTSKAPLKSSPQSLLPEHVLEAWNAMADRTGLPKVRKLEGPRGRRLSSLIRRASIEDFTEAIDAIERSPWMHGANDRGWRADFDFLITPSKFVKLVEGSYDRAAH